MSNGIFTHLPHSCKGCRRDCWGKEWDEFEKRYFCIADGFYITDDSNPKDSPKEKEKVCFD